MDTPKLKFKITDDDVLARSDDVKIYNDMTYDEFKKFCLSLYGTVYEFSHSSNVKMILNPFRVNRILENKPTKRVEYCDRCDGCGWYEGGECLKTTCDKCNGIGIIP